MGKRHNTSQAEIDAIQNIIMKWVKTWHNIQLSNNIYNSPHISMNVLFKFWMICITWLAIPLHLHKTNRTQDNNMNGVKIITKQALHHLAGQRLVSIQEAVHMVDNQELVISSNKMTYLSLAQGQALCGERDQHTKKDLITIYQNRHQKYNQLSLE
jgi:hypothetical protein